MSENVTIPGTKEAGYKLHWYGEDPDANPEAKPIHSTTTTQAEMYFADNHPPGVPDVYWLRVNATYTAPKTATMQLGLCVMGKGRLFIDGKQVVDLWTSHPTKTLQTPMFNQASMEVTADLEAEAGKTYNISILMRNESVNAGIGGAGALSAGGVRIGCCELIEPAVALAEAVELARHVDVPIVIAGLNADYESEAVDRKDLELPPGINELIEKVIEANPSTVSSMESCPGLDGCLLLTVPPADHHQPVWLPGDDALGEGCDDPCPCLVWRSGNRQQYCRRALWLPQSYWSPVRHIPPSSGGHASLPQLGQGSQGHVLRRGRIRRL